jgi:hypothetical protein
MERAMFLVEEHRPLVLGLARVSLSQPLFIPHLPGAGVEQVVSCIPDTVRWHPLYQALAELRRTVRSRAELSGLNGNRRRRP